MAQATLRVADEAISECAISRGGSTYVMAQKRSNEFVPSTKTTIRFLSILTSATASHGPRGAPTISSRPNFTGSSCRNACARWRVFHSANSKNPVHRTPLFQTKSHTRSLACIYIYIYIRSILLDACYDGTSEHSGRAVKALAVGV